MSKSPIIGVTPLWDAERKSVWMLPDYLDGIKAAGGIPVVLPIEMSEADADRIVETCDGFLFTGGQDVAPEFYGMKDATGTVVPSPERDKLETLLLSKALQADKAILGICRGLQFYGVPTHKVSLSGDLRTLLGKDILEVNTLHHQAIKDLGRDLLPMAKSPDGLIEAVKMVGKRFVCAVQWHPEYMFKTDGDSLRVFSWFVGQFM